MSEAQNLVDAGSDNAPIIPSIASGIISYLSSVIITFILVSTRIEKSLSQDGTMIDISYLIPNPELSTKIKISIWFQDQALGNRHEITSSGPIADVVWNITATPGWTDALYLVAPIVLLASGLVIGRLYDVKRGGDILILSILSSIGFAATAYMASIYSAITVDWRAVGVTISPTGGMEYLLAIVLVPLVFTAIGGFLSHP